MPTFETLQNRWRGLAWLYVPLLLHLFLYALTPEKGESLGFRVLGAGVVLIALAVMGLAVWFNQPLLETLRGWLHRFRWIFAALVLLILAGFGYLIRPEWIYPHIIIMLALTAALLQITFFSMETSPRLNRWWGVLAFVGVLAVIAIRLYTLEYYPPINITDEPWGLGKAYSVFATGEMSEWLMLGVDGGAETASWIARYFEAMGWWLRGIGQVGIWEARSFSLLVAVIAGMMTLRAAYNLYDKQTMLLTGMVLVMGSVLIYNARIRPDAGLTLSLAASLWLFSEGLKRESVRWHFLAGAAMGLGLFAHYNTVFVAPALTAALYGPRYIQRAREGKYTPEAVMLLYIAGGIIAGMFVLSIQFFPNVEAFYRYRGSRTAADISDFLRGLLKHSTNYWHFSHYEFGLFILGIATALWRRKSADWTLVGFVVLYHLGLAFFITADSAWTYYVAPLLAFSAILIARFIWEVACLMQLDDARTRAASFLLAAFLLIPNLSFTMRDSTQVLLSGGSLRTPVPAAAQWILDNRPPETRILGDHYFYLWLYEYDYASPLIWKKIWDREDSLYYRENLAEFWDMLEVDIFINDAATFLDVPLYLPENYLETRDYGVAHGTGDYQRGVTLYERGASSD